MPLNKDNKKNLSDALCIWDLRDGATVLFPSFFTAKEPQEAFGGKKWFIGHPRNLQNDANVIFPLLHQPRRHQPGPVDANSASGWVLTRGDASRGLSFF